MRAGAGQGGRQVMVRTPLAPPYSMHRPPPVPPPAMTAAPQHTMHPLAYYAEAGYQGAAPPAHPPPRAASCTCVLIA